MNREDTCYRNGQKLANYSYLSYPGRTRFVIVSVSVLGPPGVPLRRQTTRVATGT